MNASNRVDESQLSWRSFDRELSTVWTPRALEGSGKGKILGLSDAPMPVLMEMQCEKIEVLLNRVAERLEASFEAKLFSVLPNGLSNAQQFQEQKTQAAPYFSQRSFSKQSSKAASPARAQALMPPDEIAESRGSSKGTRQSSKGTVSDDKSQKSLGASMPQQLHSFFSQATSKDAGQNSTSTQAMLQGISRAGSLVPSKGQQTDHGHVDYVVRHAQWEMGQLQKGDTVHSWFERAYRRKLHEKNLVHDILSSVGLGDWLPTQAPEGFMVNIADASWFHGLAASAVILSTIFSAFEADYGCRLQLKEPPEKLPEWFAKVNIGFTILFFVELLIRLVAYRMWFFVDPATWRWNLLDLLIVGTSAFIAASNGVNMGFIRVLRTMRVVRVARVFRVVRDIQELRKLLLAISASLASLAWAVLFLLLTILVFSIFIMQGISTETGSLADDSDFRDSIRKNFNGMAASMKTLFIVILGSDWLDPHEVLSDIGFVYSLAMPVFVIFVNLGVMNIVVGVFAGDASGILDRDLISQQAMGDVEDFIGTMMQIWKEFAGKETEMDWESFKQYFYKEEVQAYLSFHSIDASHAHLLFELCDRDDNDLVDIREFVLGLLRCKGPAHHLHAKVIVHALGGIMQDLECVRHEVKQIASSTSRALSQSTLAEANTQVLNDTEQPSTSEV